MDSVLVLGIIGMHTEYCTNMATTWYLTWSWAFVCELLGQQLTCTGCSKYDVKTMTDSYARV